MLKRFITIPCNYGQLIKMVLTHDLYRSLLIRRGSGYKETKNLQVPNLTSPLSTKFERWSGKRKKLYFQNEDSMITQGIKDFGLRNNVFASLLASPMRSERNCKTKIPKDFLIQLNLRKKQYQGASKKSLELIPAVEASKLSSSSYVVNSRRLLREQIKNASKWVPPQALTSNLRYFQLADVDIDKALFLSGYESKLERSIRETVPEKITSETQFKNWDVIMLWDQKNDKAIELREQASDENGKVIVILFNLRNIDGSLKSFMRDTLIGHDNGIVLRFSETQRLVKLLYKSIAYYAH